MHQKLTAIITMDHRQRYVALCPELDIVSEGDTYDEAKENLEKAVNTYLEKNPEPMTDSKKKGTLH